MVMMMLAMMMSMMLLMYEDVVDDVGDNDGVVADGDVDDDGVAMQVRFEDDVTDDVVAAEEFVDEDEYFLFLKVFRFQVTQNAAAILTYSNTFRSGLIWYRLPKNFPAKQLILRPFVSPYCLFSE